MSLQGKYRSLKEGTLKDLEATLMVRLATTAVCWPPPPLPHSCPPSRTLVLQASCGSMDAHLRAASKLTEHWKEEAERQAILAQSVASPEIHDRLRALKVLRR